MPPIGWSTINLSGRRPIAWHISQVKRMCPGMETGQDWRTGLEVCATDDGAAENGR